MRGEAAPLFLVLMPAAAAGGASVEVLGDQEFVAYWLEHRRF